MLMEICISIACGCPVPSPVTDYALFHEGEYMTNEQMNDKKFLKLVNALEAHMASTKERDVNEVQYC